MAIAASSKVGCGTVWKRLDQPYEPGRRVHHWIKRKSAVTFEAVVMGAKAGTKGRGHERLIGAVEFGLPQPDGTLKPIAWVSAWSDEDRQMMTRTVPGGVPGLNAAFLVRRALLTGQDEAAKRGRLPHARLHRWLDQHPKPTGIIVQGSRSMFLDDEPRRGGLAGFAAVHAASFQSRGPGRAGS
jgi:hypothetical protein